MAFKPDRVFPMLYASAKHAALWRPTSTPNPDAKSHQNSPLFEKATNPHHLPPTSKMTSQSASTAGDRLGIKPTPSSNIGNIAIQVSEPRKTTSKQSASSAMVNLPPGQTVAKENLPTSPVTFATLAKSPVRPRGWNDHIVADLLSAWDSGTRDLEMLKGHLDITYGLDAGSYTVDFLRWVLVEHDRLCARVDQPRDWLSDDDPEGVNEFKVLMWEAKRGPVEPLQFL